MEQMTDWTKLVDARLAAIDAQIAEVTQERTGYLDDARKCTAELGRLRREREQVAAFPNVGRRGRVAGESEPE